MSDKRCWMPIAGAPSDEPGLVARCRLPLWHTGRCEPLQAQPASVDLPARLRAAAEVATEPMVRFHFHALAEHVDIEPPRVVDAIGRALLGEDGGRDR
jgi:hypothetical protein